MDRQKYHLARLPDKVEEQELEEIAVSPIPVGHPVSKPSPLFEKLDIEKIQNPIAKRSK